ncbi:M56 family metallopeptidase [Parvularcula sp. LCG005]|uniref:M56 family metallopeptidase n=1 Tax=Parvularcula sp. LCG005 TaxID=3078805 RepID=UPI002942EC0D|nr:M56 family metallopeptidase [Parvularcula sp. LCG005]WOI54203.1 M56 family metallopeptidase [Parvularcula sp. LCG005]
MTADFSTALTHFLQNSLWVAALIGLVLVLRRPVAKHVGPRAAYALWALPLLRLIMPTVPVPALEPAPAPAPQIIEMGEATPQPVHILAERRLPAVVDQSRVPAVVEISPVGEVRTTATDTSLPPVQQVELAAMSEAEPGLFGFIRSIRLADIAAPLAAIWIAGLIISLLWLFAAQIRFSDRARRKTCLPSPRVDRMSRDIARDLGVRLPLSIRQCPNNTGPLVCGLFHPIIVLPEDFEERFTPAQQRYAIVHELMHVRRGDLWAVLAMVVMRASQWWNPLAGRAIDAFRADQEAACDAAVLRHTEGCKHEYATTLMKSIRIEQGSAMALTLDHGLKERLTTMKSKKMLKGGSAITGAVIALGLGATASYAVVEHQPPAAPEETDAPVKVERTVRVERLSSVERPEQPEKPAKPEKPKRTGKMDEADFEAEMEQFEAEMERFEEQMDAEFDRYEEEMDRLADNIEQRADELEDLADELDDARAEGDVARMQELRQQMNEKQSELTRESAAMRQKSDAIRQEAQRARREAQAMAREARRTARAHASFTMVAPPAPPLPDVPEPPHTMVFSTAGDLDISQFGGLFTMFSGIEGQRYRHHDDGIILLTDPLEGLHDEIAELSDIGDMDIDLPEFEMPMVTVVEIKTKNGETIAIPEMVLPRPGAEAEIAAYSERVQSKIKELQIDKRVKTDLNDQFATRIKASTGAIRRLADDCADHRKSSDEPIVLNHVDQNTKIEQKILCYAGGETALKSDALQKFVENRSDLTAEQKERFYKAKSGGKVSFSLSFDDN